MRPDNPLPIHANSRGDWYCPATVITRLTAVRTRDVCGLPDVDVRLQPLTTLVGPRGSGKSRLLAAIAWLLSGQPPLSATEDDGLRVWAVLSSGATSRTVERSIRAGPEGSLPRVEYRPAYARLPRSATDEEEGWSDAAGAEELVDWVADRARTGTESEVLIVEEPELMLMPQAQRHLYRLLRSYGERNQVIYSTRAPAMVDAVHHQEIVRLDRTGKGLYVRRAPEQLLTDEQRLRLAAEFDHERSEMFFATAVVLVEGQTERLSFPPITEVGGKGNLTLASRLLAGLNIPHLIVFDADTGRPGEAVNDVIGAAAGSAPMFALDPDFEAVAGIKSHEDKVLHAWRRFHDRPPQKIPEQFRQVVETAVRPASTENSA